MRASGAVARRSSIQHVLRPSQQPISRMRSPGRPAGSRETMISSQVLHRPRLSSPGRAEAGHDMSGVERLRKE